MIRRRLLLPALLVLAAAPAAPAQSTAVVPSNLAATGGGNSVFSTTAGLNYQQVVSAASLTASGITASGITAGAQLTGLQFRANGNQASSASALTLTTFNVSLGQSNFAAGSLSNSLSGNQAADTVLARSGSISFAANSFATAGTGPNTFGPVPAFTTPYTYTGDNLLMTLSQSTSNQNFLVDAGSSSQFAATDYQTVQGGFGSDSLSTNNGSFYTVIEVVYVPVPEPARCRTSSRSR